jgi:hypothetical protein
MFKYYIIFTLLSLVSAFSQFNSIILKPKYSIKNTILNKKASNLQPLNNSIAKYKLNELKNNRLKANNIVNYTIAKYYLPFLSTYRKWNETCKDSNTTL